jgi:hypothetical protein
VVVAAVAVLGERKNPQVVWVVAVQAQDQLH